MAARDGSLFVPLSKAGTSGSDSFNSLQANGSQLLGHGSQQILSERLFDDLFREASGQFDPQRLAAPEPSSPSWDPEAQESKRSRPRKHTAAVRESQDDLDRAARIQLKNRTAQSRYRQRQKEKVEEYKATIDNLSKELDALRLEKAQLQGHNSLLLKVMRNKDEAAPARLIAPLQSAVPSATGEEAKWEALRHALTNFMALTRMTWVMPPRIDASWLENQCSTPHTGFHQGYINQLGSALVEGGDIPGSPGHTRVTELITGHHKITIKMAEANPRLWRQLQCSKHHMMVLTCDKATWARILTAMALTAEQKRHLRDVRSRLMHKMQDILRQRKTVMAMLQAYKAMDALQQSLDAEHSAVMGFMYETMSTDVISAVQEARGVIEASPGMFDMMALCNAVAEEAGDTTQLLADAPAFFSAYSSAGALTAAPAASEPVFALDAPYLPESPFYALAGLPAVGPILTEAPSGEDGWLRAIGIHGVTA